MKSVLNRPSQQLRRELALRERFWGFSGRSQSTGPPQKPQESCHPAGGSDGRREWITLKLAEEVHPDANTRRPVAWRAWGLSCGSGLRKRQTLCHTAPGKPTFPETLGSIRSAPPRRCPLPVAVRGGPPIGPRLAQTTFWPEVSFRR